MHAVELRFSNVTAFRCTYLPALSVEMIESSYDELIDVGKSEWLSEVARLLENKGIQTRIKHLRICFDDGPCYEFLCADFEVLT